MQNNNQDITLQDVINHISASKQSLKQEIMEATALLSKKIDKNTWKIDKNARKIDENGQRIDQLHDKFDKLEEDVHANVKEIYSSKYIFQPHIKMRLDRLESQANLSPVPEPVPAE